jgi:hypothetical protein
MPVADFRIVSLFGQLLIAPQLGFAEILAQDI